MEIKLRNVTKKYFGNNFLTLKNINIDIAKGDFFVILGPPKCGKSTLLRIIAGLTPITSGDLFFNKKRVNNINSQHRNLAMIFKLFSPHFYLTVYKKTHLYHQMH